MTSPQSTKFTLQLRKNKWMDQIKKITKTETLFAKAVRVLYKTVYANIKNQHDHNSATM